MITQLDVGVNFGFVLVNGPALAGDTTISLQVGQGALLKDPAVYGPYNAAYLQFPIVPNIQTDTTKEIIRITALSGDSITVIRGQEGTIATDKVSSPTGYVILVTITAKMVDDANTIFANLQAEITAGSGSIAALQATTVSLQNQINSQEGQIENLNADIVSLNDTVQLQSASLTTLNSEMQAATSSIVLLSNEYQVQSASIVNLNSEVQLQSASIATLNSEYQVQSASIVSIDNVLQVQSSSIVTLNNEVQTQSASIVTLYDVTQEQSASIVNLNEEYQVQSSSIVVLNNTTQVQSSSIVILNNTTQVQSASITTLTDEVQSQSSSIVTLNNEVANNTSNINILNNEYQIQSASIVVLNQEYQVQSSSIVTLNDITQVQSASIVTLNQEFQAQSSSIVIIQEQLASMSAGQVSYTDPDYPSLMNVQEALNQLLYIHPVITSFTNNVNTVELGETITDIIFNWGYNKTMSTASLSTVGNISPSLLTYNLSGLSLTGSTAYTLTAGDGISNTSQNTSVYFEQQRYWGTNASSTVSSGSIIAMNSEFSTSRNKSFAIDGDGEYIYYCYPSAWGLAQFYVNGLLSTAWTLTVQSFTNASGYTSDYNVYNSNTVQYGTGINIEVS